MGLDCDPNAVCDPFRGCLCKPGYQGDGTNCEGKQTNFLVLVEGVVFGSQKLGCYVASVVEQKTRQRRAKRSKKASLDPSSPDVKLHILLTVLHTFLMGKKDLSKYQAISSLVIIFFILITSMFEQVLIM